MNKRKHLVSPAQLVKKRILPTEKPLELINRLLRLHTNEGDIVLDCFAGSFVLADACTTLNRKSISIEIDEGFYKNGVNRLKQELLNK